ncbi:MAG: MGMT family protein [Nanoarchaeota archaeon]|jgi:methylated-DNA-[protein]-cysteine S-methyltransferase|nr:MGMT family protein [Nanoarchaeota archaeon]
MKSFSEKCSDAVRMIPKGEVSTYKDVANAIGSSGCRAVGTAMKKNIGRNVPCHRVINYSGLVGDKVEALEKEGVEVVKGKIDLGKFRFRF